MGLIRKIKSIRLLRQIEASVSAYRNQKLDIREILSGKDPYDVVSDAYRYCMDKCAWMPSGLADGAVRDVLLCVLFEDEVLNGGVGQFFANGSGDMAQETVLALERIGNARAAGLLKEALRSFPGGQAPKDREARNAQMDDFDEATVQQLEQFTSLIEACGIRQSCYPFLMANKDAFLAF